MYERLLRDIKKTLYKILGRASLDFDHLRTIVIDIEKHLNNRPLTYVESEAGEEEVLTPNILMWGQNAYTLEEIEVNGDAINKLPKRLELKKQHVWQRWKREYIHSLMENHRINQGTDSYPDISKVVLLVGDEKDRNKWMIGKGIKHIQW